MIKRLIKLYQDNPRLKQVLALFSVNILAIPLSFISNIIITRFLGPIGFGDFKFILYIFNFSLVLFNFGFFQACNRALVLNTDPEKSREYYGSMLVILTGIFFVISAVLLGYALIDKNIQEKGLQTILISVIPFSWLFLLSIYFESLFQADNRINLLAKSRIYPKIAFFVSVVLLYLFFYDYKSNKLILIWIFFLLTQMLSYLYILFQIKPSFKNMKTRIREIWSFNKSYGFNVYFGSLFDNGFGHLTGLLISYFGITNAGVGFFALAGTISEPLGFIPNVIATTHYKDFSTRNRISRRLILITLAVTFSTLILNWILVGPFIKLFYSPKFYPVITLTYIVSIGVLLNGFGDFFNRFLGSHGQGKSLRNSAIIVGFIIMLLNIAFIPTYMEMGAAYTKIFSALAYLLGMLFFYRRLVLKLAGANG